MVKDIGFGVRRPKSELTYSLMVKMDFFLKKIATIIVFFNPHA